MGFTAEFLLDGRFVVVCEATPSQDMSPIAKGLQAAQPAMRLHGRALRKREVLAGETASD